MSQIFHLVYTSKALLEITPEYMLGLMRVAKVRNTADGLTGFLVVRDGYFLQLLEGEEGKVRACYARIAKNLDHERLIIHGEAQSPARLIPDWSMASVTCLDGKPSSERLIEVIELARSGRTYRQTESLMAVIGRFAADAKPVLT